MRVRCSAGRNVGGGMQSREGVGALAGDLARAPDRALDAICDAEPLVPAAAGYRTTANLRVPEAELRYHRGPWSAGSCERQNERETALGPLSLRS
jgi:hypothetical protein